MSKPLVCVEVCAGAGGQAIGLEMAGFHHTVLVDNDQRCCETLKLNRPNWNVVQQDLEHFDGTPYASADLLAGGLPCPPFSVAGKQLGSHDERNLFPAFFRLISEIKPRAILIENVRGFLDPKFADYRTVLRNQFGKLGYECDWRLLNASDFGVSQLRPRVAIVAMPVLSWSYFSFPNSWEHSAKSVGEVLLTLMQENGWEGAKSWAKRANKIAPTVVGGSKKHGGPDLGPTRAREAWSKLGVEGRTIAEYAPERDFVGNPRLTVKMVAKLQGFPDGWRFSGKKTPAYRQVGNAFPAPVACCLGIAIRSALNKETGISASDHSAKNKILLTG